jgi:hypothetical protein
MQSRRNFLLFLAAAGAGIPAGGAMLVSCNAADVETNVKNYFPTIIKSISSIVDFLAEAGLVPLGAGTAAETLITFATAGEVAALAAIDEYENDPAADKATLKQKILTILVSISDQTSTFVASVDLSGNPIAKIIVSLVGLLIGTLGGFINDLAAKVAGARVTARVAVTVAGAPIPIIPKKRSRAEYVAQWNAALGPQNQKFAIH